MGETLPWFRHYLTEIYSKNMATKLEFQPRSVWDFITSLTIVFQV